jgi:hypothetical protein
VCFLLPASLSTMSISPGIVVAVALKQIDNAPDTQARAQSDYQSLQNTYCRIEKCHIVSSLSAAVRLKKLFDFIFGNEKSRPCLAACVPALREVLRRGGIQLYVGTLRLSAAVRSKVGARTM